MERQPPPPSGLARGPLLALLAAAVAGASIGPFVLAAEWSVVRQMLAGGVMGAWCGLLLMARRLMM